MNSIYATQQAFNDGAIDRTYVLSTQITRYFDAEEYLEDEYMKAIAQDVDYTPLSIYVVNLITSKISQTMTNFYSFKFIDTSNIQTFDFGTELTSYQIESKQI